MSDTFRKLFPLVPWFSQGELPTSNKLNALFGYTKNSFENISNVLGPLDSNKELNTKRSLYGVRSLSRLIEDAPVGWSSNLTSLHGQVFNLARLIGPAAALNPSYLSDRLSPPAEQGFPGILLPEKAHSYQLPFRHDRSGTFVFTGDAGELAACFATRKNNPVDVIKAGDWCLESDGILYSYRPIPSNCYLKYSLITDFGSHYKNAGYNVIPDPSILRLSDVERTTGTGSSSDYGAIKFEFLGDAESISTFKITLPKVISLNESLDNGGPKNASWEPVGTRFGSANRYTVSMSIVNPDGTIDDNLVAIWDNNRKEIIHGIFSMPDSSKPYELLFRHPSGLVGGFGTIKQTNGTPITSIGQSNTKDLFLLTNGTNLTTLVSQINSKVNDHRHDGINGQKVQHSDLDGVNYVVPGFESTQEFLDLENYNRILPVSPIKGNDHSVYLSRHGFKWGGTAGDYDEFYDLSIKSIADYNMYHGDFVFGPIHSVNLSGVPDESSYSWEVDQSPTVGRLSNSRSHSLIFGIPSVKTAGIELPWLTGATRLYYDPSIKDQNSIGSTYDMALHGISLGDFTSDNSNSTLSQALKRRERGLVINWGNLFFGLNEDKGRGAKFEPEYEVDNNINGIAGEINFVATANGESGNNTNSKFKRQTNTRDGIALRAARGASIHLSAGASKQEDNSTAVNKNNLYGNVVIEAALNPSAEDVTAYGESLLRGAGTVNFDDRLGGTLDISEPNLAPVPGSSDSYLHSFATRLTGQQSYSYGNFTNYLASGAYRYEGNTRPGGFKYIGAFSPRYLNAKGRTDTLISPEAAKLGLGASPWGTVLIEATRYIKFLVNTPFTSRANASSITTGLAAEEMIDVTYNNDNSSSKRSDYGEVQLWGVPGSTLTTGRESITDEEVLPTGANVNLMSYSGLAYKRLGLNLPWVDVSTEGKFPYSPWMSSRLFNISGKRSQAYGSNIRNASTVEAFEGFRSDPLQPYIKSYDLPFRFRKKIGLSVTEAGIHFESKKLETVFHTFDEGSTSFDFNTFNFQDNGVQLGGIPNDIIGAKVWLDHIVRWHDNELGRNQNRVTTPYESLVSYNLALDTYVVQDTTSDEFTLNTNICDTYAAVNTFGTKMYDDPGDYKCRTIKDLAPSITDFSNVDFVPVKNNSGSGTWRWDVYEAVSTDHQKFVITPELGLAVCTQSSFSTYKNSMTNVDVPGNLNYCLKLTGGVNLTQGMLPFRVFVADEAGNEYGSTAYNPGTKTLWIEYTGHLHLNLIGQQMFSLNLETELS